jgi:NADH-quinone oxidoreductase subunit M
MNSWPILSLIVFLPLVGAALVLMIRGEAEDVARRARAVALWTSMMTFVLSLALWAYFDPSSADYQFVESKPWIPGLRVNYTLGVDGISILFVVLSSFLIPICVLASWRVITERVKEYMIAFLVMETMMNGVFCALDMVLFYVFFEAILIPMFLIIGVWGGPRKVYAAFKFFLYTLAGSVLFLIALLVMIYTAGSSDIPTLADTAFDVGMQYWLWIALFASFAVKVPMWPLHTWLPDAHVEAPTAGSVILAGVLLKLGGYGFIRFSLPMLPEATEFFTPFVYTLSVVAVIYTSLVALMQNDMKKLIAYSSVAHMGFVTIGLFTLTTQGAEGGIMVMLSHGIVSAALFLCVGVVYDRMHSREISSYGGLVHRMPAYAFVFMLFTMASIGLPGTGGFIGELLVLIGVFQVNTWVAALAALGVILGAAYMLWLYRRVIFGALTKDELKNILDLDRREIAIFAPLILVTMWMGIYPNSFLGVMHASVEKLLEQSRPAVTAQVDPAPAMTIAEQ